MSNRNLWIILVAGGSGNRFGSLKQFEKISDKSVLDWSIQTAKSITENLIVVLPEKMPEGVSLCDDSPTYTTGGHTRSSSVRAGLVEIESKIAEEITEKITAKIESEITEEIQAEADGTEIVLVHDAVRPLADRELFISVAEAIQNGADAAVPTIPLTDTINTTDGEVIDRTKLLSLQTPQAFRLDILREIHSTEPEATDDISLCIHANKKVAYIDGSTKNLKITEPIDIKIAELLRNEK